MAYSSDLRKHVLAFIEAGGKKTEACQQFSIARATVYTWLNAEDPSVRQKPDFQFARFGDPANEKYNTTPFSSV